MLVLTFREPDSMIFYFQLQRLRQETQTHPCLLSPGVPRHVVQRLLQDAIDMHSSTAIHRERLPLFLIGYGNSGLSFYVRDVPVERALQSRLIQHYWMQRLRETANTFQCSLHDLKNFLQIRPQRRTFRSMRSRATQHRPNRRENLAEFIVQFERNVAHRGFLSSNQFLRQFAAAFGDFSQAREQSPIPANHGKAVQQDREKSCGQKNINLALPPPIDLTDALPALLLILAFFPKHPSHSRAQCCLPFL